MALVGGMLVLAAVPWIIVGWFTSDWRGLWGGTAFLLIPQIFAWLLFVGLRTGRMPSAYGRSELRSVTPIWFWLTGCLYAGILGFFIWIILFVFVG